MKFKPCTSLIVIGLLFVFNLPFVQAQNSVALIEVSTPYEREASQKEEQPVLTSINLTYYFDSRSFNTLNILTSSKALPLGFNFWGFTDIHAAHNDPGHRFDLTRYFMEYRLRRPLNPSWVLGLKGLGLELEYNDLNGSGNGMVRAGLTLNHPLPLFKGSWLQWRFAPYESDKSGTFAGIVYFMPISERFSIIGFADLNIGKHAPDRWVSETELNIKIKDRFNVAIEGRYNGFEAAAADIDGFGIAFGLKFKPQ